MPWQYFDPALPRTIHLSSSLTKYFLFGVGVDVDGDVGGIVGVVISVDLLRAEHII